MQNIPRFALIITPKQPLIDWVNTVLPDVPMTLNSDDNDESSVYLAPKKLQTYNRTRIRSLMHRQPPSPSQALELEIALEEITPKIWRTVLIAPDTTFLELHYIIQFAMGWTNSHLHHFMIGNEEKYISVPDPEDELFNYTDSATTLVSDYLHMPGDTFIYEYDFGDCWTHRVTLNGTVPTPPGVSLPIVTAGARACPPEDCGNKRGYALMLETLKNPRSRAAKEYKDWLGYVYDPESFNLKEINAAYFKNFKKVMKEWDDYANSD